MWHMEPQLVRAAKRGQAALLDSQLSFSSMASTPVIHTGHKDSAALLPHLAPGMAHSHSRGPLGTAPRLLQASTCPGHLQPPGLLVCRVKWHQQVKSSLQPKARSFQPTFECDKIPTNPTKPTPHSHSSRCSLTLCFNPSAPHHAEVLPKIPERKAKHNL